MSGLNFYLQVSDYYYYYYYHYKWLFRKQEKAVCNRNFPKNHTAFQTDSTSVYLKESRRLVLHGHPGSETNVYFQRENGIDWKREVPSPL